jgi:hypothetical protein
MLSIALLVGDATAGTLKAHIATPPLQYRRDMASSVC